MEDERPECERREWERLESSEESVIDDSELVADVEELDDDRDRDRDRESERVRFLSEKYFFFEYLSICSLSWSGSVLRLFLPPPVTVDVVFFILFATILG